MATSRKMGTEPLKDEKKEENRRIRIFRFLTFQRLSIEKMTLVEARDAVGELRETARRMFPGKLSVFDLVIAPRMERVIRERFGSGRAVPYH